MNKNEQDKILYPVIVTFKRKDKRSKSADKQKILQSCIRSDIKFLTSNDFSKQGRAVGSGEDLRKIGYDVNRYEAPILMANLKDDDDVVSVEPDGKMYAIDLVPENGPNPLAQTIPNGITQIKAPDAWPSSQIGYKIPNLQ